MKRAACLGLPVVILLLATAVAGRQAAGQGALTSDECPLPILGTWRPEGTTEANPTFLSFAPDGWVSLLSGSGETRAQDFDIVEQVRYRLLSSPTRIEFRAVRGGDVLPPGITSWELFEYGDSSFTTLNRESGEQSLWTRVQTHRYFLTFAARSGTGDLGGPSLAMWTKLDGRKTEIDGLGVYLARAIEGDTRAVFGRIPGELSKDFAIEGDRDSTVMMRLELTEAEYQRTHDVFEAWERRVTDRVLGDGDPYRRAMEFLGAAGERLNQCAEEVRLEGLVGSSPAESIDNQNPRRRPLEFIRLMRTLNARRHVADGMFPFVWEPPAVN